MFEDFKSTLKEASFDQYNNKYLVKSEKECVNFDSYKDHYCADAPYTLRSVDALYYKGDNVYFIEFKNRKIEGKIISDIKEKCYDSLMMYLKEANGDIKDMNKKYSFILVTNGEKNKLKSFDRIRESVRQRSDDEWSKFKRKFETYYFKSVRIMDTVLFEKFINGE